MTTVADLRAVLEASSARKLRASGNVWRLGGNDHGAEELRSGLLSVASLFTSVYVHYDGGGPSEPSLRDAEQVAHDLWRLPMAATGPDLSAWLYMGNWQLYAREEPLQKLQDLCRASDGEVASFVAENDLLFIVDSFHDDAHWTIGLRGGATTPNHSFEPTPNGAAQFKR
jgi:hypothetical protein